jgi:peptide/nickel transport system permease protein
MRFALRRLGFFAITLWAALTLNFFLPRLMPGNPAEAMMAKFRGPVNPQALKAMEAAFGVNTKEGIIGQYFHYLGDVFTGNFGTSLYFYPQSVARVILDAIPWTLGLVGVTTVLAFLLGTGIGILAAWRRGGRLDSIAPPLFVITSAIPYFWVGMMLILVFAERLQWFPAAFGYSINMAPGFNLAFIVNIVEHAVLPACALLITTIGTWILTMRNTMVTTLA